LSSDSSLGWFFDLLLQFLPVRTGSIDPMRRHNSSRWSFLTCALGAIKKMRGSAGRARGRREMWHKLGWRRLWLEPLEDRRLLFAPSGTDKSTTIPKDGTYTFLAGVPGDFGFTDQDEDIFTAVRITQVPSPANGTLRNGFFNLNPN
jgi:hypothetical protein